MTNYFAYESELEARGEVEPIAFESFAEVEVVDPARRDHGPAPESSGLCPPLIAGSQRALTGDEGRSSCSATLLSVIVGKHYAFLGDAIDVRRAVTHYAHRVGADVGLPDVIAKDDEDVWFLAG